MTNSLLTKEVRAGIDHWLKKFPEDKKASAVIPALHLAQESNDGFLTRDLMESVADYLEMPQIAVYEVATFYSMFDLEKTGKYKINVCTNVSCMLSGSEKIVEHFKKKLGIDLGETTEDGKFTLREVECLAACTSAPVCQIGKEYFEKLTPEKVDEILEGLE